MALLPGTKLGRYEILVSLGAGGMGEVYRARDPKFGRDVAVKVLPASFSSDSDRLQRFEQEAKAAGQLNHPVILSVYDSGTEEGAPYLVSELLEGETLRIRLDRGPLQPRKAIELAVQIAHGLAAAHEKGIVHRDLKPENLFLTKDGRAKILDFGLAKLMQQQTDDGKLTQLPTSLGTEPGVVLGTIGYMSPEQVRGKTADARSDIFAFGAILYEMLSGRRAFTGSSAADTMSAILNLDPAELPSGSTSISPALDRIVRRCMEKAPERRFQTASDLAFALESLSASSGQMPASQAAERSTVPVSRWAHPALTILLAAAALFFAVKYFQPAPPSQGMVQAFIAPPESGSFQPFSELGMALSPDGKIQAFVALTEGRKQLWIRRLDEIAATHLTGTDGATYPFWSPDSHWIAFFAEGKLKKIEITGSPPSTLCGAPNGRGGTWNDQGVILFAPSVGNVIYEVASTGGESKPVTKVAPSGTDDQRWPSFLPDGKHFLFSRNVTHELWMAQTDGPDSHLLISGCSNASYVSPGYLIFSRSGALMAQAFDPKQNRLEGEAFPVIRQKIVYYGPKTYAGFSVSYNGVLSYLADETVPTQLTWVDRTGKQLETVGEKGFYQSPRLSPDGKRMTLIRVDPDVTSARDIWIYELDRQSLSRFTFQPLEYWTPLWSADGHFIFFGSGLSGVGNIYRKASEGSSSQTAVVPADSYFKRDTDCSADGKFLAFYKLSDSTANDIWILPLAQGEKPFPYLQTPFEEWDAQFSPDSKWIAYTSNESGRREVYVQSLPLGKGKWQISNGGGLYPRWGRDGKEIFFSTLDDVLKAVEVTTSPTFSIGSSASLFKLPHGAPYAESDDIFAYDISSDGRRFLLNLPTEPAKPSYITLVLNWTEELHKH